jgi:hypothetical protein
MASTASYQRLSNDDAGDLIIVRIWELNGETVAETDCPVLVNAEYGILAIALGNPMSVPAALAIGKKLASATPFQIGVFLEDEKLWLPGWGTLLPAKPPSLVATPLK